MKIESQRRTLRLRIVALAIILLLMIFYVVFRTQHQNFDATPSTIPGESSNSQSGGESTDIKNIRADGAAPSARTPTGTMILFIASDTKEAIAGARTLYCDFERGNWIAGESDRSGALSVPAARAGAVLIRAKYYVPLLISGAFNAGTLTIELAPLGALELNFRAEDGRPVEGVEAELCIENSQTADAPNRIVSSILSIEREASLIASMSDPVAGETHLRKSTLRLHELLASEWKTGENIIKIECKLSDELLQKSNVIGKTLWRELSPKTSYRWKLKSPHSVEMAPPHELYVNRFLPRGKGVVTSNEPPDGISGIINIEPRKTLELQIPIYVLGSIRGRILNAPGEPADGAHIKLYHERHFDHPEPGGLWINEMKVTGMQRSDEDGRFLFRGVKPGKKELGFSNAYEDSKRIQYRFARAECEIHEGESVDIGDVRWTDGSSLLVRFVLQDEMNKPIPREELFIGSENAKFNIIFTIVRSLRNPIPEHNISEVLTIPIHKEIEFRGLHSSEWHLGVVHYVDWPPLKPGWSQKPDSSGLTDIKVVIPETREITIPFTYVRVQDIKIKWTNAKNPPEFAQAYFINERAQFLLQKSLSKHRKPGGGLELDGDLSMLPGDYRMIIVPDLQSLGAKESGFLIDKYISVKQFTNPQIIEVGDPMQGVSVSGRYLNSDGGPNRGRFFGWSFYEYRGWKTPPSIYFTQTDDNGRFQFRCLPPNSKLISTRGKFILDTSSDGTVMTDVVVQDSKQ
ncbi:MAG: hypothetical protein ACKVS6_05440 [Planctomycetota bacterium]